MNPLKNNQSLFHRLESISNSIYNLSNPNLLENTSEINELGILLKLNQLQIGILAVVATKGPDLETITEARLMALFSKFNRKRSDIILAINQLIRTRIIEKSEPRNREEFQINKRYYRILENEDWDALNELNAHGIVPLLKRVVKIFNQESHRHSFFHEAPLEDIEFEEELNLEKNAKLTIIQKAKTYFGNNAWDFYGTKLFFYTLARKVVLDEPTNLDEFFMSVQLNQWERKSFLHQEIISEKWAPIMDGYFEIHGNGQVNDQLELDVSDSGIEMLLPELDPSIISSLLDCKIITIPHKKPSEIEQVKLIFDEATTNKLRPIQKSLNPTIREKIKERLGKRKLGLTTLFYGYPGTGKTEFCYQMAKEFDLPILEINVAQIQNKWVGESEKNARKVFDQYKKLRKQSQKECILLFNEADALLGKRIHVNNSVDAMNNSVKNIFLEEMERFEGILFATTNLTENLDLAFERRFLFKVFFEKPDLQSSAKIWKLYFPTLTVVECSTLAKKFNFSPGEISNIYARFEIEKILGNKLSKIKLIEQLASEERIKSFSNRNTNSVGFG
jgi:hypothetical protein